MGNIIDYVKEYGDKAFSDMAFNEVDGLVLSQFAYFKWENVIPELPENAVGITLNEMAEKMQEAEVFSYERYARDNRLLWDAMLGSKRYGNIRCNYLSSSLRKDVEVQFCAFVATPPDALPVVLFRGTDETILGWKEDYNMSFDTPMAGHRLASLYLKQVVLRIEGDFVIAGHSKGGNLAVFSALDNDDTIRKRIFKIYDYDGPHFRQEIIEERDFPGIREKIHKLIPESSVVGIMLETEHLYEIVKSRAFGGVRQHYPYTWIAEGCKFKRANKLDRTSLRLNELLNESAKLMTNEQIEVVGSSIFGIIEENDIATTEDILKGKGKSAAGFIRAIRDIDDVTKEKLKEIFIKFMKILYKLK